MPEVKQKQHSVEAPKPKGVPEHFVEHFGSIAVEMVRSSHEPDSVTLEEGLARTAIGVAADVFRIRRTAEQAPTKVHSLLDSVAISLEDAYEELYGGRDHNGAPEGDQMRRNREREERESVYRHLIEREVENLQDADSELLQEVVEKIVLLEVFHGESSRRGLRDVVRAGRAHELQVALNEFGDVTYPNSISSQRKIRDHFADAHVMIGLAKGEISPSDVSFIDSTPQEKLKDITAATVANPDLQLVEFERLFSSIPAYKALKYTGEKRQADGESAHETNMRLSRIIEETTDPSEIDNLDNLEDPIQFIRHASSLDIPLWQAVSMLAVGTNNNERIEIDASFADDLGRLKQQFPDEFKTMIELNGAWSYRKITPANITAIETSLSFMKQKNILVDDALAILMEPEGVGFSERLPQIAALMRTHGVSMNYLREAVTLTPVPYIKDNAQSLLSKSGGELELHLTRVLAQLQVKDYSAKEYRYMVENRILPRNAIRERPQLKDFSALERVVEGLGLGGDVSARLFEAWMTYDAARVKAYGLKVKEADFFSQTYDDFVSVGRQQAEAISSQVESLAEYIELMGAEDVRALIDEFGIHNFNRYDPYEMRSQLKHWREGTEVKNLIIDSRSDWNSYSSSAPIFEDYDLNKRFIFEANSAEEVARIARLVGKREREQGREPDVTNVVLHAHGSSRGLVMGVDGERIDTSEYVRAAQKHQESRQDPKQKTQRFNTYKQHLGENFSLILSACSTAGEISTGNIAQWMKYGHKIDDVFASDVAIYKTHVHADGTVSFSVEGGMAPASAV